MLTKEREKLILSCLERHERISTVELSEKFNISKSTIRRDLARLEQLGKLSRIHGGAEKISMIDEPTYLEKTSKNTHEKQLIAQKAVRFISDNEVIYLDAGTTTSFLVPLLKNKTVKVVTNSLHHATNLVNSGVETIVLGGQVKTTTDAIIGMQAVEQLKSYQINRAFIGVNGVHEHFGYSTPDSLEAMIKRAAIEQAEYAYVLADKTKQDKVTFCKIANLNEAKLIIN